MSTNGQPDAVRTAASLSYKYQRLRERLRQAIVSGELSGRLPGERMLAQRYQANAKTINKALTDLAMDGLLVRHVGRGTFVAGSDAGPVVPATKQRTYGWLTGEDWHPSAGEISYRRAAEAVAAVGHRLELIEIPSIGSEECCERTLTPNQLRELSGLILFAARPSDRLLADLNRRHLPAVIANNRHETIRTPVVLADYAHGAFELTQHLIQLGHQEIGLVIDGRLLPAAGDAVGGHHAAMGRYGLPVRKPIDACACGDWLAVLRSPDRPTALICVGMSLAVEAAREATDAGLGVPEHISLAVMAEPGAPQAAEHQFTSYEVPSDRIVDWATKLLLTASPGGTPRMVVVPGRLHVRRTTARPAPERMSPLAAPGEAMV